MKLSCHVKKNSVVLTPSVMSSSCLNLFKTEALNSVRHLKMATFTVDSLFSLCHFWPAEHYTGLSLSGKLWLLLFIQFKPLCQQKTLKSLDVQMFPLKYTASMVKSVQSLKKLAPLKAQMCKLLCEFVEL